MKDLILKSFKNTIDSIDIELQKMSISLWNESVFRYYFCRSVRELYPDAKQFIECNRIDLIVENNSCRTFIEFKFYGHPTKFDPYSGKSIDKKGGPSKKNLQEFQDCVNKLCNRESVPGLSKYIVLMYADPREDSLIQKTGKRPRILYDKYYNEYTHTSMDVSIQCIESSQIIEDHHSITAKLYEIGTHSLGTNE